MVDEYDRWKCRDFLHDVLRVVPEVQLPLFWYYLVENKVEVLALLDDATEELPCLCQLWQALTPRERAVLEVLILQSGSTVTKNALAQSLFSLDEDSSTDAIEIYVHRLRRKLDASSAKIITLRGLGYLLRQAANE